MEPDITHTVTDPSARSAPVSPYPQPLHDEGLGGDLLWSGHRSPVDVTWCSSNHAGCGQAGGSGFTWLSLPEGLPEQDVPHSFLLLKDTNLNSLSREFG